mgnify:CR=1 FL=1
MPAKKTTSRKTATKRARKTAKKAARKRPAARKRAKSKKKQSGVLAFFASVFSKIVSLFTLPFRAVASKTQHWPASIKWLTRITVPPAIIGFVMFLMLWAFYSARASSIYDKAQLEKMPARTVILDRKGKVMGHMHGSNRYMIKIENVPRHFVNALIAREDARFTTHGGVDFRGLMRSVKVLITKGDRQGGSTLTMQLADNSFNYDGKSIDGKLLEMALARRIESDFEKDEILEMYINRIFWGGSIHGVESAARTYFEKSASKLTLSESAMLTGIISAPNAFSPFRHFDRAIKKRDITLASMVQYGFITQAEADAAMKEQIHIRPPERRMIAKSYAMAALRDELDVILEKHNIKMGGLKVITTLDLEMQNNAEKFLQRHLRSIESKSSYTRLHKTHSQYNQRPHKNRPAPNYVQGALVCLENHTGAVIAIVGGRDPRHSEFNRALNAKRQIGSVFKPFVYLSAFDQGMSPNDWISDEPLFRNEIKHANNNWNPRNSDGVYRNSIKVSDALAKSRNTSSIRVGNMAGIDNVIDTAKRAGFKQKIDRDPSIYLGSFSATPMEVAKAYTAFPNDCIVYRPFMIQEIRDSDDNVVYRGSGVIWWDNEATKKSCREVSSILQEATRTGTGRTMRSSYGFSKPAAGKTGTTNGSRDGWFAGYTTKLTCAVWVGMDDNSTVYRGASGSSLALPVWAKFMKAANNSYPAGSFENRAIIIAPASDRRTAPSPTSPGRAIIVE